MAHQVYTIKGGILKNITQAIGNLSWSSDIDTLGVQLSFEYVYNDTKYFESLDILEVGMHVIVKNNNETIFKGIIVTEDFKGRFGKEYTCFDYAFYLNKSETIIQFNNVKASEAIKKLLSKFNVPVNIVTINTLINKIYKDKTVSDVIKNILEQATNDLGIKYRLEMRIDKLYIEEQNNLVISPTVRLASNLALSDIANTISEPTRTLSIEDMKNKIKVVSDEEKSTRTYVTVEDTANIEKYGLLQEIVTVSDKDIAQVRNIAKNKLAELNKVSEEIQLDLIGHDDIRAGRILELTEKITSIAGRYEILIAEHKVKKGIHTVSITVKAVD